MHHVRDALPTLPAHALQLVGTVSGGASAGPSQLGAGIRPASKWWRKAMLGTIALATLVAIGCDAGSTPTATPLIPTTWTAQDSTTTSNLTAIYQAGDTRVAVGAGGTILSSSDGTTWTSRTSGTSQQLNGIHHDGTDTWVTVGASGTIISSSDGTTWTSRTSGTSQQLNGIHHDGTDSWVAVGASGTILTSSDGTTWTSRTSGTSQQLNGIHHDGDSTWITVGEASTILTSSDGTLWTSRNSGTTERFNDIHHDGDDTWVAVGAGGAIRTTSDPTGRWIGRTSNVVQQFFGIHHANGIWVAVGARGTILTSSDGSTWTSRTSGTPSMLTGIHHDGTDTWVAVGNRGTILTATPTANPPTAPPIIPLPPAASTINLDQIYTNSDGSSFRLTIAEPLFKVYAITLLDGADATMSGDITLSIGRAAVGDADARLRKGPVTGLAATASPTSGQPLEGGTVWLFLPGDDGTDLPEDVPADFAMLWQTDDDGLIYPSGSNGPLAASLDYTLSVTAPAGRTWQLRVTDISATSPPRLPSAIQTRARRGMCDTPVPMPLPDDTVTCDEGGPAVSGQGLYLLYNPDAVVRRARLDRRVLDSDNNRVIDTSPNDDTDTNSDGLIDTINLTLTFQDCMPATNNSTGRVLLSPSDEGSTKGPGIPAEFSRHVYCVQLSTGTTSNNLASDNLQFTLNP